MKKIKHTILLIDDDKAYSDLLLNDAKHYNISLLAINNLNEGVKEIENNQNIDAVILDGYCIEYPNQKLETASASFVLKAIKALNTILYEQDREIPYCVNTDVPDLFKEIIKHGVFLKGKQHKEMFSFLKEKINKQQKSFIKKEYSDFFEALAGENLYDLNKDFISLISDMDKTDKVSIVANLTLIRRLQEKYLDKLYTKLYNKDPYSIYSQYSGRTRVILDKLKKDKNMPAVLFKNAINTYKTCSAYGNHNSKDEYFPSQYYVKGMIMGLIELVLAT